MKTLGLQDEENKYENVSDTNKILFQKGVKVENFGGTVFVVKKGKGDVPTRVH